MGLVACFTLAGAILAFAFTTYQDDVGGVGVPSRWPNAAFTWVLDNSGTPPANVDTTDGSNPVPLKTALLSSFNSWATGTLNGQQLANISITNGTDVTNLPAPQVDCANVVTFNDTNKADFPTGTVSVAFTTVSTDYYAKTQNAPPQGSGYIYTFSECNSTVNITTTSPSIVFDADIAFNPGVQFSTSTPALTNAFDLQSVATHEAGHALGLDHSGVAHAVMFPAGDTGGSQQRTLASDDLIAISFLYPSAKFLELPRHHIRPGLFPHLDGNLCRARGGRRRQHRQRRHGYSASNSGSYNLYVPPGNYNVMVLPLGADDSHGVYSLSDFSGWSCGYSETAPPCCDAALSPCLGAPLANPTNYTGKFF